MTGNNDATRRGRRYSAPLQATLLSECRLSVGGQEWSVRGRARQPRGREPLPGGREPGACRTAALWSAAITLARGRHPRNRVPRLHGAGVGRGPACRVVAASSARRGADRPARASPPPVGSARSQNGAAVAECRRGLGGWADDRKYDWVIGADVCTRTPSTVPAADLRGNLAPGRVHWPTHTVG